jgi:hypothetical protein
MKAEFLVEDAWFDDDGESVVRASLVLMGENRKRPDVGDKLILRGTEKSWKFLSHTLGGFSPMNVTLKALGHNDLPPGGSVLETEGSS